MAIKYYDLGVETVSSLQSLIAQRDHLDGEIVKLQQLLRATLDFLPRDEQEMFASVLADISSESVGLTDAIRNVLKENGAWLSALEVRDRLLAYRFDFSRYTSNPLASVHAVLKRLTGDEVASRMIRGTTAYRWRRGKRARTNHSGAPSPKDSVPVTGPRLLPAHEGD